MDFSKREFTLDICSHQCLYSSPGRHRDGDAVPSLRTHRHSGGEGEEAPVSLPGSLNEALDSSLVAQAQAGPWPISSGVGTCPSDSTNWTCLRVLCVCVCLMKEGERPLQLWLPIWVTHSLTRQVP